LPQQAGGFGAENFRERDRKHRLIGSVHNLNVPASPVLVLPIAFRSHVAAIALATSRAA
jgi:hypothetical protein